MEREERERVVSDTTPRETRFFTKETTTITKRCRFRPDENIYILKDERWIKKRDDRRVNFNRDDDAPFQQRARRVEATRRRRRRLKALPFSRVARP